MNKKIPTLIFILGSLLGFTNCNKDCEIKIDTCKEIPPSNEACEAYFSRWFFTSTNKKCEQIGYSGCSMKGFETKLACEACKCD